MANFYTPDTAVYLCNTPLNVNKKDTYAPNGWTQSAQLAYFQSCRIYTFNDFTFQRKDGIIRVPINIEELYRNGVNYCYYRNSHYRGKWFFCFITQLEFLNEATTALHIKTDVFQTWYFEMELKTSFVEREHTVTDNMFQHTLPEPLPTPEHKTVNGGDYSTYQTRITPDLSAKSADEFNNNYWCAVFLTEELTVLSPNAVEVCKFIGGNPCACYIYAVTTEALQSFFGIISASGKIDSVISCVAMPKSMVDFHPLTINPNPPDPPLPPISDNFLGSPYASAFFVTQIYNAPQHWGIDLDNNDNLNMYATTDGEVTACLEHPSFGKMVIIKSSSYSPVDSSKYYYFMYCHMDTLAFNAPGSTITRGTYIGTQGSTGSSTASHCHYEVQIHGALSPMTTAAEVGNTFGHDVISLSQSVNPTMFTQFPNVEGYYE